MKKLLSLFVALIATTALLASNTITYTAKEKLTRFTLDVGKTTFGSAITSHTFSNGTGTIICNGEITTIGAQTFYNCIGLKSVTIPNSVTTIGDSAFYWCPAMTSVTIPNSVITIGYRAFAYCDDLTSVTIPNSVTTIGNSAFSDCIGLTSVTIGSFVTTIGKEAFYDCQKLKSVTIGNSVTTIGKSAFALCYVLTSVIIPNSVTTIGESAFLYCSGLTSVTIGSSVTTIGDEAFVSCSSLNSINVDAANTHYCSVDGVLFNYAKDTLIQYPIGNTRTAYTIPNSVTMIGKEAFASCRGLKSVTIPNSVTMIGEEAFAYCDDLTSVTIPNSITTIAYRTFYACSGLTSVTIPNSVTSIGYAAFSSCSGLTSITIPNSVTSIGESVFSGCTGLTSPVYNANCFAYMPTSYMGAYTIPDGIKRISSGAFYGCSGLTSVTIPKSVITMASAFYDCNGLTSITCYVTNPPYCGSDCFNNVDKSIPVYVPAQSVDAYKQARSWKDFTNILPIGAEVVPTTEEIITEPSANEVTITWPQTDNADTYTLEICKSGDLICTFTFNSQGAITNIAFAAPARGGERTTSAAELTVNGYKFTVTGLDSCTEYTYTITAKNASAQPIQTYSGSFKTTEPTGLENLTIDKKVGNKFIYGNQLYLRRGNKIYNAAGAEL